MATTHPTANGLREALDSYLRILKLPTFSAQHEELARQAEKSGWTFGQFLHRLCEVEIAEREQRRVARFQKQSGLPLEKTMASLDMHRFPAAVRRVAATLCDGAFAGRAENVLAFGLPGRARRICCVRSPTSSSAAGSRCCSSQRTGWCSCSWRPSATSGSTRS